MSEPNKDGTDIMMALLMGLSGPRASKAWNESQQIKAESFLTMAEHWINQTAEENARLKAEVERLTALVESNLNKSKLAMAKSDASVRTLEAHIERLTKAGDELSEHAINREWMFYDSIYSSRDRVDIPEVKAWNAAKEGKQP
jgi:cell division protein FtsB